MNGFRSPPPSRRLRGPHPLPSTFRPLLALALLFPFFAAPLQADTNEVIERVAHRFIPEKPAVKVSYSVTFRFLGLEIRQLATATITAVEGAWQAADSTKTRPACLVSFRLDSLEKNRKVKRGIILHNHIQIGRAHV